MKGVTTLHQEDFEQLFRALKPVIDDGRIDDYFSQKPISEIGLTEEQCLQLLKYINAYRFVSVCKKTFGFTLDYTPESLLYLDIILTALCALDLDDSGLGRLFYRDANMSHEWDEAAYQFILTYTIKNRHTELQPLLKNPQTSHEELLQYFNDGVVADLMENINCYLCETALKAYSGRWVLDSVTNEHTDALGVQLKNGDYISFMDAIYRRFYEEDIPLCYIYCAIFHLDYSEMPDILGAKYRQTHPEETM